MYVYCSLLTLITLFLQTNGEIQSNFLVDYMKIKLKGCFQDVKVFTDFAGIHRFVGGYKA